MADANTENPNGFMDTLRGLGPARLAVMGVVMTMLLAFFIFVSLRVSEPSLSVLYSELTNVDSAAIAGKLETEGIDYRVSTDGTSVFVQEDQIGRARMLLAEAGLPNGGSLGYELFDQQSGFGTTTFVQNLNNKRAMEGELARTVMSLDQITAAKVHIVLPQRELFAREAREATASVTIKLNPSARLNKKQVYAIQNLVANAVPELRAQSVTVLDSEANLLAGGEAQGEDGVGTRGEDMRRQFEARLAQSIEELVGPLVGVTKVRATVTADMNFDRVSMNAETFDPEGQVLRSSQVIEETAAERNAEGDGVTVDANLPGVAALGGENGPVLPTAENNRIEELTNYEISRTVTNTVREGGQINRLSVAVIIDDKYAGRDEDGNAIYEARSEEEMNKIEDLVRSAMGYDSDRGDTLEIANLRFAEEDFAELDNQNLIFGFAKEEILETVQMVTLGIMLILVILLVIKPILTQLFSSMQDVADATALEAQKAGADPMLEAQKQARLAGPDTGEAEDEDEEETIKIKGKKGPQIDMQAVEGNVKASTVKKVGEIVEMHPNETVSVLRQWMTSE